MATTAPTFTRKNLFAELPDALRALTALETAVAGAGLEPRLLELVRTRVSQRNGCAFCLDMHQRDARKAGERQSRLDVLAGWREASCFDAPERAALALAESLTALAGRGPSESLSESLSESDWQAAERVFEPRALAGVVFAVAAINAWNRVVIASGMTPPDRGGD